MIEADARPGASPFPADAAVASRMAELSGRIGPAIEDAIRDLATESVISATDAAALVARFELGSTIELALLALPVARELADPPISGYRVGAVGIERETGDLVLGGNREFPGTELTTTVHAEGFVSLRARRRGNSLTTVAVSEAHPCAHCRQTLAEAATASELVITDPLGHRLTLADLNPWGFQPRALGMAGDAPGRSSWPNLAFVAAPERPEPPADVAALLLECGTHAHAPYSGAPSAVVVRLWEGRLLGAGCVESVAFNPSIGALQAALVEVAALPAQATDIAEAWLARTAGGRVDPEPGFRALLRAAAPAATRHVVEWRTGARA